MDSFFFKCFDTLSKHFAYRCFFLFVLSVFYGGVSMELRRLGQTSGFRGHEPWVNFKLLPPSRSEGGRAGGPVGLRSGDLLPEISFF